MQLCVYIGLEQPLILPINYNHILQSVIYHSLGVLPGYATYLHEAGFGKEKRQYRMFQFGQLKGNYKIENKKIIFESNVMFEVRSPEPLLMNLLAESFRKNGVIFGERCYRDVEIELFDYTVEETELRIQMCSPVTVYTTDSDSGTTYYYGPDEPEFYQAVQQNFYRKYQAYYGVRPTSIIQISEIAEHKERKFVTKYQGSYITGWFGMFCLSGERKYLDFLYQTGLGAKNAQGFGMFQIL